MNRYYLYRHIRLDKNEPFYIGIGSKSSRNHPNIKSEYRRAFEKNRKESSLWNNIINKTDYRVEILLESDNYEVIKEKEREFIKLYGRINKKNGCLSNMTDGGDGFIGYIPSQNKIQNHIEYMTGKRQPISQIQKRIESRKGYKHSEETKQKISSSHKGLKISKDHLAKLFAGQIRANSKSISQYTLNGEFIKNWQSATVASKILNIHPVSIRHCVQNKTHSSGGYIWKSTQHSYK